MVATVSAQTERWMVRRPMGFFAEWLTRTKERRGLSGNQLAAKSGIGQSTVSKYETGSRFPSRKSVLKLAKALEVDPEEGWSALLKDTPHPLPADTEVEAELGAGTVVKLKSGRVITVTPELLEELERKALTSEEGFNLVQVRGDAGPDTNKDDVGGAGEARDEGSVDIGAGNDLQHGKV